MTAIDSRGRPRKTAIKHGGGPVRDMSEAEVAWLAGIFDGEGCLSYGTRNNTWALTVGMTDRDVIERLLTTTEAGRIKPKPEMRPNRKPVWVWRVNLRWQQADLLRAMRPWLSERRCARIDEFEAWLATAGPGRIPRPGDRATCARGHDPSDRTPRGDCRPCVVVRSQARTRREAERRSTAK